MWSYANSEIGRVVLRDQPVGCSLEREEILTSLVSPYYRIVFKRPITVQVCRMPEGDYVARVLEYSWWEGSGLTPEEAKNSLTTYIFGSWLLAQMPDEELAEGAKEEKRMVFGYIEHAEEK